MFCEEGEINLPLAWIPAAIETSIFPIQGHYRYAIISCTHPLTRLQPAKSSLEGLFQTWAAFEYTVNQTDFKLLIENLWKSVSTLLWLGFTINTSHSNVHLKCKTFINFLTCFLLKSFTLEQKEKAQDLERLSSKVSFNIRFLFNIIFAFKSIYFVPSKFNLFQNRPKSICL